MTERKKQELRQLLNEAMASLEIRDSANQSPLLPEIEYRRLLLRHWLSQSTDFLRALGNFGPHITNETTKSKLLDFIREEFKEAIHNDHIQSACSYVFGLVHSSGFPLGSLLEKLLNIAIACGAEAAVLAVDRCSQNVPGSFQYRAFFEGIEVESDIQVFEGIRIVQLPDLGPERTFYLPGMLTTHTPSHFFDGKALLIIDAFISPIFCNPRYTERYTEEFHSLFQVEVANGRFLNFNVYDFYEKFCHVLSLACNSAVKISVNWAFLSKDQLFDLERAFSYSGHVPNEPTLSIKVGQSEIVEAKDLYETLVALTPSVAAKLQIPIERWIKSKTEDNPVDKVIDLGIAFESLYLSDRDGNSELSFQFRLRASWHLGNDKEDREKLIDEFKAIYTLRSKAVHNGSVPGKIQIRKGEEPIATSEFIPKAQDLCRDSIIKILEDGQFPDWNNLILG